MILNLESFVFFLPNKMIMMMMERIKKKTKTKRMVKQHIYEWNERTTNKSNRWKKGMEDKKTCSLIIIQKERKKRNLKLTVVVLNSDWIQLVYSVDCYFGWNKKKELRLLSSWFSGKFSSNECDFYRWKMCENKKEKNFII